MVLGGGFTAIVQSPAGARFIFTMQAITYAIFGV
jgi:hypothetical protein